MGKKYADFMDEISADDLYKGLLAFGLFSNKIPPVFSSTSFFDYCVKNHPTFSNSDHMLKLRLQMAKSSVKKYQAAERCVCPDGRVRGRFQSTEQAAPDATLAGTSSCRIGCRTTSPRWMRQEHS